MVRHATWVTAFVAVLGLFALWWVAMDVVGARQRDVAERALVDRAERVADVLLDRGVVEHLDRPGGADRDLELLGTGFASLVLRDATGAPLAGTGEDLDVTDPPPGVVTELLEGGLVRVEGVTLPAGVGALRVVLPVATTDGGGVVLDAVRATGAVGPAAARAASAWVLGVVGLLVVGVVLVAGRARDRTVRDHAARQHVALDREARAARAAEELERVKADFLTAVSHEVRTPLQVIEGTARLLATRGEDLRPDQLAALVDGLAVSSGRLTALLRDLIDVDRLVRGLTAARREHVDLTALVRDVLAEHDLDGRAVSCEVDGVHVVADPGQLGRVLDHLVHNAVRHTPPGTPIAIRAHREDDGVELVVADEGPGIPGDLRLRVFDPLFRIVDGRPDPGVGIGLALVRRLVELHGGRAWVEEAPGGGAELHVRVPDEGVPSGIDAWAVTTAVSV